MFAAQIITTIQFSFLVFTVLLPTFAPDKKKQKQGTAIVPFFFIYGSANSDKGN